LEISGKDISLWNCKVLVRIQPAAPMAIRTRAFPRDKGVPIEVMRRSRIIVASWFVDGKWKFESKKVNRNTTSKMVKKMHKKKRRQWERLIENGSRSG